MKRERSCGAVVFTTVDNECRFVIIRSQNGIYGFPKGHMNPEETERYTALREIREETGLNVRILPGFRRVVEYTIPSNGNLKKVVYFLAKYSDQEPVRQPEEIKSIELMNYEDALRILPFKSSKDLLRRAYHAIVKNKY